MPDLSDLRAEYEAAGFRPYHSATNDCDLSMTKSVRDESGEMLYQVTAQLHDYTRHGAPEGSVSAKTTAYFYRPGGKGFRVTIGGAESSETALAYYEEMFDALGLIPDPHNG